MVLTLVDLNDLGEYSKNRLPGHQRLKYHQWYPKYEYLAFHFLKIRVSIGYSAVQWETISIVHEKPAFIQQSIYVLYNFKPSTYTGKQIL